MRSKGSRVSAKTVLNVQALRGYAALIVAAYHVQPMLRASFGVSTDFEFGAFGVDVFFVISGFVMYYGHQTVDRPILPFLIARFFRIVPLYWIATLIMVALFYAGFHPNGLNVLKPHMVGESLMFVRSTFPGDRHGLILLLGWTLIYELFFYFVFALTFRCKTASRSLAAVATVFVVLVGVGFTGLSLPPNIAYFTKSVILEFVLGGTLTLSIQKLNDASWKPTGVAALASVVAIAIGCVLVVALARKAGGVPDFYRGFMWGPSALLVVGGAVMLERAGYALGNRATLLLGGASYMLYLFHPLIMQPGVKVAAQVLPLSSAAGVWVAGVSAICAAVVFAVIVHLTLEKWVLMAGRRVVRAMGDFEDFRQMRVERALLSNASQVPPSG
ncbi:exopolysaccharide production protein ExoZ [Sphingomonas sp. PvP056]